MRKIKIYTLLLLLASLCSCSAEDPVTGFAYSQSCITGYLTPQSVVVSLHSGIELTLTGEVITSGETFDYWSNFYNDLSYNRYKLGPCTVIADGLREIKIETDDYFDVSHPAGSDISDLLECNYISFYDYIQNGYKEETKDSEQYEDFGDFLLKDGAKLLKENLCNLNSLNTRLSAPKFILKFKQQPANKGKHSFRIVITVPERQIETSCEYTF
jgi:hypothetical protein